MPIHAVLWDYDNTLLATADAHFNKHKTVLSKYGILLGEEHRQAIYHNNGYQNWAWMKEKLGLKIPQEEYLKAIDTEFLAQINQLEMRPGIKRAFELFKKAKIPQVIVTNAREASAKHVLEDRGILLFVKFVLYRENYQESKPHPECYQLAIKRLGEETKVPLVPQNCLAIEDDPKGVEAALKAGARVIHRKLRPEDPNIEGALSCFEEEDFLNTLEAQLNL